jgi:hypothetical protein
MQALYRGYRKSFEDDKLVSSLKRMRENEKSNDSRPSVVEEIEFARVLEDVQKLVDSKKRKEALMALVAARLRLSGLRIPPKSKDRLEAGLTRLRAEIDAM